MNLFSQSGRRSRELAALAAIASLVGCANPGPLEPPSAHLPELARSVTASRSGPVVTVRWLPPRRSSDGAPLHGGTEAMLCRTDTPSAPCTAVAPLRLLPPPRDTTAAVTLTDNLPSKLTQGPPRAIFYRVEQRNSSGKSAGPSAPVLVLAGAAPADVEDFTLSGSRQGVVLRWKPAIHSDEIVEVSRTSRPNGKPIAENLTLEPDQSGARGMVDTSAKAGDLYTYTAVRVARVTQNDGTVLTLSGESTPPQQIRLAADYAPQTPSGLLAVAEFTQETGDTLAINLSWTPPMAAGLRYNVYREAGGERKKLNPIPLSVAAFRDAALPASGPAWSYTVTAIDKAGMESSPSTPTLINP